MWTAKAHIRLRICAVWYGPTLTANRTIGYYRMYEMECKDSTDLTQHILCMVEGTFLLEAAYIF